MITIDTWTYSSGHRASIQVTGTDILHQTWTKYNNLSRVGYKVYQPDGTVLFPETMVSNEVSASYPTSCIVNQDSVALFWREGASAWFTLRNSSGSELIPTSLLAPDSYVHRPNVVASSDTLGRIHCTIEIATGVCYVVFDPEVGEVFRDTIPGSYLEASNICVDGNRVHIYYTAGFELPAYIQYDLSGNIVIPPVELVQDIVYLSPQSSVTVDSDGNFWCLLSYTVQGAPYPEPYVLKIDGTAGNLLLEKEVGLPDVLENDMNITPGAGSETMYLMWRANNSQSDQFVYFAILDKEGNFIEEPYPSYDYSDEDVQNIFWLDAASNEDGDVFAVWTAYFPEVHANAYYVVMGWFDHNWVGIEGSDTSQVAPENLTIACSANPFDETVEFTTEGSFTPEQLHVFDTSGRLVRTLLDSGGSSFFWDGRDSHGVDAPAGCYTVIATTNTIVEGLRVVKLN